MKFERQHVVLYYAGLLPSAERIALEAAARQIPQLNAWMKELGPGVPDMENAEKLTGAEQAFEAITESRQGLPAFIKDPSVLLYQRGSAFLGLLDGNIGGREPLAVVDVDSKENYECKLGVASSDLGKTLTIELPVLVDTNQIELVFLENMSLYFEPIRRIVSVAEGPNGDNLSVEMNEPMAVGLVNENVGSPSKPVKKSSFNLQLDSRNGVLTILTKSEEFDSVWIQVGILEHVFPVRLRQSETGEWLVGKLNLPQASFEKDSIPVTVRPIWLSSLFSLSFSQIRDWVETVGSYKIEARRSGEKFMFSISETHLNHLKENLSKSSAMAILSNPNWRS